jgi:hypothetical protein
MNILPKQSNYKNYGYSYRQNQPGLNHLQKVGMVWQIYKIAIGVAHRCSRGTEQGITQNAGAGFTITKAIA